MAAIQHIACPACKNEFPGPKAASPNALHHGWQVGPVLVNQKDECVELKPFSVIMYLFSSEICVIKARFQSVHSEID
jgi:hypothetical protein